jgi:replicative DNA helicase
MKLGTKKFQNKLISFILTPKNPIVYDLIPYLKPEYFDDVNTRVIFEKINEHFVQYKAMISIDYLESLLDDDQTEYLKSVIEKELKFSEQEDVKQKTMEFIRKQITKNIMLEISEDIDSPMIKYESIKKRLMHGVTQCDFNADQELDVKADFDDDEKSQRITISTGWKPIDELLDGGAAIGELALIAAPPGGGKSHLLIGRVAEAWRTFENDNDIAVYFTMELPDHVIKTRVAAYISSIPFNDIKRDNDEKEKAKVSINKLKGTIKVKEFPGGTADVGMLHSYLEKVKAQGYNIKLIAIDYPEEMALDQKNLRLSISNLYTQLRALGHRTNFACPVWAASQINRENSEEQVITAKGLAEAFSKAGKVDVLISLTATHLALLKNRAAGKDHIVFNCSLDTEISHLSITGRGEPLSSYLVKGGISADKIDAELKKLAKKYKEEDKSDSDDPKILD